MDAIPSVETQASASNEGPKELKIEIKIEIKKIEVIGVVFEARDTTEDVKDFLEKDK